MTGLPRSTRKAVGRPGRARLCSNAIRTVAERRLGQILATERDDGRLAHHGVGTPSESTHATLTSIGISGKLSARAAKLAEPDDVTFERDQAEWRERMADAVQVTLPKAAPQREPLVTPPLPEGRYSVVVIDPPWPMKPVHVGDSSNRTRRRPPGFQRW